MRDDQAREAGRAAAPPSVVGEANVAMPPTAESDPHSHRRARFRAVYDTNYRRVLGYVLRRTATREDAEDVVAETFLTAWRRLEQLPHGCGARPWLYGVARRALANHRRGELRRERLAGRLLGDSRMPSQHTANADREVAWVAAAFARLDDDDRELLALVAWEGLDVGEVAAVLGCSRNAVRIRLHRARRCLAHELEAKDVEAKGSIPAGDATARSLISVETESGR
jgi:RNA polymerase sigma-70 factor, ECF subfamily